MRRRQFFFYPCGAMDTHLRRLDKIFNKLFPDRPEQPKPQSGVVLGVETAVASTISRARGMRVVIHPTRRCRVRHPTPAIDTFCFATTCIKVRFYCTNTSTTYRQTCRNAVYRAVWKGCIPGRCIYIIFIAGSFY